MESDRPILMVVFGWKWESRVEFYQIVLPDATYRESNLGLVVSIER